MAVPKRRRWMRWKPYVFALMAMLTVIAVTIAVVAQANALSAGRAAAAASKAQSAQAHQLATLAQQQAAEANDRLALEAKLLCGGFVPISHAPAAPNTSTLGYEILAWARQAAALLECPGR